MADTPATSSSASSSSSAPSTSTAVDASAGACSPEIRYSTPLSQLGLSAEDVCGQLLLALVELWSCERVAAELNLTSLPEEITSLVEAFFKKQFEVPLLIPSLNALLSLAKSGEVAELQAAVKAFVVSPSSGEVASSASSSASSESISALLLLLGGCAALLLFLQLNWTGPAVAADRLPIPTLSNSEHARLCKLLTRDGEPFHCSLQHPELLLLARDILFTDREDLQSMRFISWWKHRCVRFHQSCLLEPTATLWAELQILGTATRSELGLPPQASVSSVSLSDSPEGVDPLLSEVESKEAEMEMTEDHDRTTDNEKVARDEAARTHRSEEAVGLFTQARYLLEEGLGSHHAQFVGLARDSFATARRLSGVHFALTGVMGSTLQYQTQDRAQLTVEARSRFLSHTHLSPDVPKESKLDGTELLSRARLANPSPEVVGLIHVVDQQLLLAECLNIRNFNPVDEMTNRQVSPYVTRVVLQPLNWTVHATALLERSRLEFDRPKTAARAILQLESLLFQKDESTAVSDLDRFSGLFGVNFPGQHTLKREVGKHFLSMNIPTSALPLFQELQDWDAIVRCYQMMGKRSVARELIEERIQVAPTPALYHALGEISGDIKHYEKAWKMSEQRYAPAQRSLASRAFAEARYSDCISHCRLALNCNGLQRKIWFLMGCAGMRSAEFDTARTAFRQVVQLDPENAQAWSNLGSIHLRERNAPYAMTAYGEALKHLRGEGRIWQNYTLACMQAGNFQKACYTLRSMANQELAGFIDVDMLKLLAGVVDTVLTAQRKAQQGLPASEESLADGRVLLAGVRLTAQQARLLGEIRKTFHLLIATKLSANASFWEYSALLHNAVHDRKAVYDAQLKRLRVCRADGKWLEEESRFEESIRAADDLLTAYLALDDAQRTAHKFATHSLLENMYAKAEARYVASDALRRLRLVLDRLQ